MTESEGFAGYAAVAPCRVVGGHLDDEATQLHRGAGPPGRVGSSGGRFGVDASATGSLVRRASQIAAVATGPPRPHPAGPGPPPRALAGCSVGAGLRSGGAAQ